MHAPMADERKLTHLDFTRLRRLPAAGLPAELDAPLNETDVLDPRKIAPGGAEHFAQIEEILFQPEATGDCLA
jgi:hypothetical protein